MYIDDDDTGDGDSDDDDEDDDNDSHLLGCPPSGKSWSQFHIDSFPVICGFFFLNN